jgi:hypothetical protein
MLRLGRHAVWWRFRMPFGWTVFCWIHFRRVLKERKMQRRFPRVVRFGFLRVEKLEVRRLMSLPQGTGDMTPPSVLTSSYEWDARQAVTFNFSEPIDPASVATGDVFVLNLSNGQMPLASSFVMSAGNTSITWIFNSGGSFIEDGRYRFELRANSVSDPSGNGLSPNSVLVFGDIYFLGGDANRDHAVNTLDFNILAGNFGLPNKTFIQGDFDYAGTVDSTDFNILASRYGKVIPALAPSMPSVAFATVGFIGPSHEIELLA